MGNVIMEATQINYRRDDTLKTVDQKLQELSQESAIDTDIAPVFKSTSTYNPGDLVYYRNKLYKCTTQHTGAWAAGDFTATDVSTALNTAAGTLNDIKADYVDIAPPFDSTASYVAGDLVEYQGIIYRCTNDHSGDWDADDFSATTIAAEIGSLNSNFTSLQYGTIVEVGTDAELAALLYNKKNYKKSFLLKDSTKTMALLNKYDTTYAYVTFYSSEHVWDNHPDYTGNFGTHIICGAVGVTSTTISLIQTYQAVTENVT